MRWFRRLPRLGERVDIPAIDLVNVAAGLGCDEVCGERAGLLAFQLARFGKIDRPGNLPADSEKTPQC